ncbi:zinc ribbon binding domain protein [Bacillus phage 000TH008]|nr:zinc ribbon binding domain protein [Bacillus phage 000TH008]
MTIKCDHCGKDYKNTHDYIEDCFISSDGWCWDYYHNCLKAKGIEIHGYKDDYGEKGGIKGV